MPAPKRHVSTTYLVMLSVGMVVGAGIFKSPAEVAAAAGSEAWIYFAWLAGGLLTLCGALCYSELATAFPSTGGDYHFLELAYGRRVALFFAWTRFSVINSGSIAFLGFVIGDYLDAVPLFHLGPGGPAIYATVSVLALTLFNLRGTEKDQPANYAMTGLEVAGLLLIGVSAAFLALRGVPPASPSPPLGLGLPPPSWALGLVFVLLAFGGWSEIATLSAEVKDARRGMAYAHVISIAVITVLYLLVNWAFLRGLGFEGLARSAAPAADLMSRAFGSGAAVVLALAVALAAVTSINATIVVGARTTYAAARDFASLGALGRWDQRHGIPRGAIWAQGAMSLGLVGLGATTRNGFATLVDYTAPAFWIFMTLSGLGLVVLRRKQPGVVRPFRTPLYPLTPIAFCAANVFMLWSSVTHVLSLPERGIGVLSGALVTLLGVALIALLEPRKPRAQG